MHKSVRYAHFPKWASRMHFGCQFSGLAAILPGGPLDDGSLKGKNVVVPLCGGNIDTTVLGRVIDRGLAADGRYVHQQQHVSAVNA